MSDAEAGREEAPVAAVVPAPEPEIKPSRKGAPHLRVVSGDAATDFVAELPPVEPAPTPEVLPNQRIGSAIRARRETLGYSLDQVSKDTRVHLSHLRAIEEMTPNLLGAPVYAKGYIRAYARYLGLDEMSTLERYLRECAILKDPEKNDIAPPQTGRRLPATVPVLGFLIVALLAAGGYFFINGSGGTKPVAAVPAPSAIPSPDGSATEVATAVAPIDEQDLYIVALRRSEVEIRSADGTKIARRELEPGEKRNVRMNAGWTVSATTDGSAFYWERGGRSLGLLGEAAAPIYAQSADIAAERTPVDVPPAAVVPDDTVTPPAAPPATGAVPSTATPSTGAAGPAAAAPRPSRATPRPRPPQQTQAAATGATTDTATPPAATTPPPAQPTAPATTTPAQDPALAAYPNQ